MSSSQRWASSCWVAQSPSGDVVTLGGHGQAAPGAHRDLEKQIPNSDELGARCPLFACLSFPGLRHDNDVYNNDVYNNDVYKNDA